MKVPVAVFCYKRPDHLDRLLASLAECRRLQEVEITYFCDGPARSDDARAVEKTRVLAERWRKRLGGQIVGRENNLGLARSIFGGVSALCNSGGRVIVLEDDLVVNADFVDFHLRALDRYADEEEVWQISGFSFLMDPLKSGEPYFLPIISTWGWSTWQRAWARFAPASIGVQSLPSDQETICRFNIEGAYNYTGMLRGSLEGRNDSWGIRWNWTVFQQGGLVLYPPQSLAYNAGYDGTGSHCNSRETTWQPSCSSMLHHKMTQPISFPTTIAVNELQRGRLRELLLKM